MSAGSSDVVSGSRAVLKRETQLELAAAINIAFCPCTDTAFSSVLNLSSKPEGHAPLINSVTGVCTFESATHC